VAAVHDRAAMHEDRADWDAAFRTARERAVDRRLHEHVHA
jgi:hypothetical protein